MSEKAKNRPLNYLDAGVNISAGNELVEKIKTCVADTHRDGVIGNIGGFGGLFELSGKYKNPVLVSGTDGVGTKLKLAIELEIHNTIGIDLVAMCVNDILVSGAEPLFFLDYFATAKLDTNIASDVIRGIAEGCKQSGAALIGGETAEMPGMYKEGDYDLAGFCVGVVEKNKIIDGSKVKQGDKIIALASSGPHSNGYSLIRKILEISGDHSLKKELLTPTRIYVNSIKELGAKIDLHAIAHITGGGITENIPRILPDDYIATINTGSWEFSKVFKWLQENGNVKIDEMYRTFNCGIGMIVIVDHKNADETIEILNNCGESVWCLGEIEYKSGNAAVKYI